MAKTIDIDVAALDECLTKLRDVLAELEGYVPMCDEASGSGKVVSQLAEIDSALDEVKSNLSTLITTSISFSRMHVRAIRMRTNLRLLPLRESRTSI